MRNGQPKKYLNNVKLKDKEYGLALRKSYSKTILDKAPVFPKPLEYKDIDKAFNEFVEKEIDMVIKEKKVPTFTLYSNQRFSEYSQTWSHVDEEGNLLTNFKTVSREPNPKPGENQGGLWNIPGDKKYTLLIRDVLEDNGNEAYEIFSMKQPYCVDLTYRISIIADMFESLNDFNEIINDLFKARQCYIRPNGHYIPMILDDISDNTEYTISDRKFYGQTATIKVMAYIIREDSFEVEKKPKTIKLYCEGLSKKPKAKIDIDEYYNNKLENTIVELTIDFKEFSSKTEFEIDTDFKIENIELYNIRSIRVSVNDIPYYIDKGFEVKNGDNIKVFIRQIDPSEVSQVKFNGINPSDYHIKNDLSINVSDDKPLFDDISVE